MPERPGSRSSPIRNRPILSPRNCCDAARIKTHLYAHLFLAIGLYTGDKPKSSYYIPYRLLLHRDEHHPPCRDQTPGNVDPTSRVSPEQNSAQPPDPATTCKSRRLSPKSKSILERVPIILHQRCRRYTRRPRARDLAQTTAEDSEQCHPRELERSQGTLRESQKIQWWSVLESTGEQGRKGLIDGDCLRLSSRRRRKHLPQNS